MSDTQGRTWFIGILALVLIAVGLLGLMLTWGRGRQESARSGREASVPAPTRAPNDDDLPAFGEFVYVEQLPEAKKKVPPHYPEAAQFAGVEGTVVIQALIGRDGLVKQTKVVKAIPGLDEAAEEAVRQWTFEPARTKGEPVAVWVAVPVRFTLH